MFFTFCHDDGNGGLDQPYHCTGDLLTHQPESSPHQPNLLFYLFFKFIYNIRRIARLFPTVHYALNLRDAARNELDRNMERRYDFRCRRKPKCSEKTCAGKYGSRTKFTYDSDPNRTRAALVKGTGTTTAPTRPPQNLTLIYINSYWLLIHFNSKII